MYLLENTEDQHHSKHAVSVNISKMSAVFTLFSCGWRHSNWFQIFHMSTNGGNNNADLLLTALFLCPQFQILPPSGNLLNCTFSYPSLNLGPPCFSSHVGGGAEAGVSCQVGHLGCSAWHRRTERRRDQREASRDTRKEKKPPRGPFTAGEDGRGESGKTVISCMQIYRGGLAQFVCLERERHNREWEWQSDAFEDRESKRWKKRRESCLWVMPALPEGPCHFMSGVFKGS